MPLPHVALGCVYQLGVHQAAWVRPGVEEGRAGVNVHCLPAAKLYVYVWVKEF